MNFFKQSSDQARQAINAMPLQSRVIAILLMATIAISLAFLFQGSGGDNKEYLFGGRSFEEQELTAIQLAFGKAGLNDWVPEGRRIKIPRELKATYLAALDESTTIPMSLRSRVQEAINATSHWDSDGLRQSRIDEAQEQDLADSITRFADIRWASVEYDQGDRSGLSRLRPQSASVFVEPLGNAPLPRNRIHAIKELVRASYAGMNADDVVVIDANSTSTIGLSDEEDQMLRKQIEVEALTERKVRKALQDFPARIAVYAEIDPTMDAEQTTLQFDAEGTTVKSSTRNIDSSSTRPTAGGVPGTATNATATSNRQARLDENVQTNKLVDKQNDVEKVTGKKYESSRLASLTVKSINVSVGLPISYYETIHAKKFLMSQPEKTAADVPPMSPTDLADLHSEAETTIKNAVSPMLPDVAAGEDRSSLVQVYKIYDPPEQPLPAPETTQQALTWLADSWQTIALVCLALIALLVARSAAKSSGDSTPTEFREGFGLELPQPPPELVQSHDDESMTITGSHLKDELISIVEGNPEVAANVIRSWVGEAA